GCLVLPCRVACHRGLDVVPRVEVMSPEPRDRAVLPLHGEDAGDGGGDLLGRQDTGEDEVFGYGRTRTARGSGGDGNAGGGRSAGCARGLGGRHVASASTAARGRCGLVAYATK